MQRVRGVLLAAVLALAAGSGAAAADPIAFTGTLMRSNPGAAPGGRCVGALTVSNNNVGANTAIGTSNLGDFLEDASQCLPTLPPAIAYDGQWRFDFAQGSIGGNYSAIVSMSNMPGVFNILGTFVIAEGTRYFGGATGTLTEHGTLDRRTPPLAYANGTLTGLIDVPEPATLALTALGIAGLALTPRRMASRA